MEIKEKQIEEMAGIIGQAIDSNSFLGDERMAEINMQGIAKELLKHYQPKIPKDSVVSSREEYQKDFSSQFNKGYKHGSKETAEKAFEITKKIIDKKYAIETPWTRATLSNIINQIEKEFAKQFDVEIKE